MLNVNYRNTKKGVKYVKEMCSSVSIYTFQQVFDNCDIFVNTN